MFEKKRRFLLIFLIVVIIIAVIVIFFNQNQVCYQRSCTADIRTMCNPNTGEVWEGPSGCNCGTDAELLKSKGWVDCS